jgi:hypothetical protein
MLILIESLDAMPREATLTEADEQKRERRCWALLYVIRTTFDAQHEGRLSSVVRGKTTADKHVCII